MNTKHFFLLSLVAVLLFSSCMHPRKRAQLRIAELEKSNYQAVVLDTSLAMELVTSYLGYVEKYRLDSMSAEYLIRTGSVYMNLNKPGIALYYFRQSTSWYPKSSRAPYAWFLQAFVTENYLRNYNEAIYLYKKFLAQYPRHQLHEDAQNALIYAEAALREISEEMRTRYLKDTVFTIRHQIKYGY